MKNNIQLDTTTLREMSCEVRQQMTPIFDELRNNIQSENLEELSGWYMKIGGTKNETISEIANKVVEKTINCFPQNYVKFVIENIDVDTKKSNVQFDVNYELDPLRVYVEFQIKVDGNYVTSGRVRFEINMRGSFKELKFVYQKDNKKFHLGKLESNIAISLVGLPFVESIESYEIANKQFTTDLSRYCVG